MKLQITKNVIHKEYSWPIFHSFTEILVVFFFLLTANSEALSLDPGDLTISHTSGSVVIVDNNKPCPGDPMEGMGAGYVSFEVCNTSGSTLSDLSINLGSFTGAGFGLGGGQVPSQFIGSLSNGEWNNYYWFVDWPCSPSTNQETISSDMTASVTDNSSDTLSTAAGSYSNSATMHIGSFSSSPVNSTMDFALNDPPIAKNDTTTTAEDTPVLINILINDIDPDGNLIGDSIRILIVPVNGDTSSVGDSLVKYTPDLNFTGLDSFQYEVCDTSIMGSQCDTAWVFITVTAVNDPPTITEVPQTTPEDTPVTFCPTLSDSDTGDTLTMSICGGPQNGTGNLVQMDTCITYTPTSNYTGPDTICVKVCDQGSLCDSINVPITVTPYSDPPIAKNDTTTTAEDTPVLINILINDIDPDGNLIGDSIRILIVPVNGDTSSVGDSLVKYTPDLNFTGLDSFQYEVCDTSIMGSQCDTAWVFITVTAVNDPPTITEVPQTTPEDTPVTFCPTLSDSDTGDTLTMSICGGPQNGTGNLVQMDTCITYTPTSNYTGPDTICVKVCDQGSLCDSINVPITVTPYSDPPIAKNDTTTTAEDTPVLINILINDIDPDGNLIGDSIRILIPPVNGDTSSVGDSLVTYTPDLNFTGLDSFQYEVCDTSTMGSQCDTAWVFITVTAVNDPPTITEVPQTTPEDTPVTFCPTLSDSDTGDTLTMSICGGPQNGTGNLVQMDTCITYTPTSNYTGPDTICVKVCDQGSLCDSINVPITVTPYSDPPIAKNDTTTTAEDTPVLINILINDIDPDGNLIGDSIRILIPPVNGDTSSVGDSLVTYTPDLNFTGLDSFQYEVCDTSTMGSQCDTAWVFITVTAVNDPPTITEVPQTTPEDTPVTFCPTLSDSDTGDTLTMSICGGPQNGTGNLVQMDTCITYTPTSNYTGPDTICVKVCDQGSLCDSINVPITVTPYSDPPIAKNDTTTTAEDTPVLINILINDIDPDGNLIGDSIRILIPPVNGDTSSVGDSLVTYTPDLNFTGLDSFQYEVCDTSTMGSQCDTAWVFMTITPDTSFFDLAFRKTVTDLNRPVQWGDTLEFIFHVFNQGSEIVQNVELVDYPGDGFIFDTSLNSEWSLGTGNKIHSTIPDTILPGDSVVISLNLIIRVGTQEEDLINYGEVSDFEDKDGIGATDNDSTPDESNSNDGNVNDDEVDNSEGDEDDHDIAITPVFDLALRKTTVGGIVSVEIGDIVTYHIEIFNQGNIDARSVEVSDFPEDGLTFLPTQNPDWKVVGNKYEYIPTLDIDVGAKADIYIILQVNNSANNSNILNQAEIINARDASGVNMSPFDIDSSPDDDFGNDVRGLPGSNSDNLISGIGIIDEDDHDPAPLNLCGQIACIEKINVSVKNSCSIKITPEMVLVDTFPFQPNHFDLEFFDLNGNEIDSIRINERMKVLVRVPNCVDAICWSEVLVEDKIAPTITCAPTDTILCNKMDTHVPPTVIDLCNQGIDIQLVVENFEKLCPNDSIIGRTIKGFRAIDQSGNISNTCFDTTYIKVPNIANATFPGDTTLICNAALNTIDSLKSKAFSTPTLNGLDLSSDSAMICNINASFEDMTIVDIPCKKQILRMWTVRQWLCNGTEKTREMPQLITLKDTISPQITILDTLVVKATNHECKATFNLPGLQVKDDCDNDPVIDISTPEGVVRYSQGELIQLSIDTHTLVIQAFDNCHNVSRDTFVVIIADHAPPVNLCLSHTTIALNDVGEALVDASVFDQGSFDGCSAVTFLARRMTTSCTAADTSFGKTVKFCCEDIDQNIMVQVQATDKSGNTSICMVNVTVQDKDLPALHCPPDITVNCNLIISDTTIFGNVTFEGQQKALLINPADVIAASKALTDGVAFGSCLDTIFLASTTANIDQCNAGTIKRVFTVRDMAGLESSCTQTITIIHDDNAPKPAITYPPDTTLVTCDSSMASVVVTGSPTAIEGRCNMIGFAFVDQIVHPVDTSDNLCLKIIRKWSVFEHCSTPFKLIDTHDQIIKLVKNQTNSFVIGGSVISLYDEAIAKVDVAIHDISENGLELEYTDNSGNYVFSGMPWGGAYSIKPHKNHDWPNGVSTLDMILIQNHILGKVKIEDGYNLVAADVNKDANVSAIDLVLLRRVHFKMSRYREICVKLDISTKN